MLRADGAYSQIVMRDQSEIRVSKNLAHLLSLLPADCDFFVRLHRSFAVNVNYISSIYFREESYFLQLEGLPEFKLPRTAKQQIMSMYLRAGMQEEDLVLKSS
jgi:DNA-binding LytR/AlgR family response regulator